jgi:energy-converting hydrogenase Eha subunit A
MIPEYFAVIGAIIASLGGLYYLYETIAGKAQPNRVTWLLWGIFPMVIFAAQRAQGVEGMSWTSFVAGFTPLLVVTASFFNKKAYWKTEPRDYYLMAAAIVGIILWAVTDNPNLAILFSLLADLLAGLPTLIKCYKHPASESWIAYAISTLGFGISVLSIQQYTFENYAFAMYLLVVNGLFAALAVRGRRHTQH